MTGMSVYIVTKNYPVKAIIDGKTFSLQFPRNEAVFASEAEANDYIRKRQKAKDRDDFGCIFKVEPWYVPDSSDETGK